MKTETLLLTRVGGGQREWEEEAKIQSAGKGSRVEALHEQNVQLSQ